MRSKLYDYLLSVILINVQSVIPTARLIESLPGAPSVSFKQYSGYYELNGQRFMHFIFVESQNDPANDPVILWLTGGPGCSGMMVLFDGMGPYIVKPNGESLSINPWSWNQIANLLIFESPPGVGYSYVTDGDLSNDDERTASENYEALVKFFIEFPQFRVNDFFVAGESYGGVFVPTLVHTINNMQFLFRINLKGMMIGNGCVSKIDEIDTLMLFMYYHGLIGEESSGLNPYNMYANCQSDPNNLTMKLKHAREFYVRTGKKIVVENDTSMPCVNDTAMTVYMNQESLRKTLRIPDDLPPWSVCSDGVSNIYHRIYEDMHNRMIQAIKTGIHALLYSGDVDLACNFLLGQRFVDRLGLNKTRSKQSYRVNGQIGGFKTEYGLVTFATVRGAGHMVPVDKPQVALYLIKNFIDSLNKTRSERSSMPNGHSWSARDSGISSVFYHLMIILIGKILILEVSI